MFRKVFRQNQFDASKPLGRSLLIVKILSGAYIIRALKGAALVPSKYKVMLIILISAIFPLQAFALDLRTKDYNLKIKLKPEVRDNTIYWQDKKQLNWQEEIKNWHFGFLSPDTFMPPALVSNENYYLFNFIDMQVKSRLKFQAASTDNKQRVLDVWVNGKLEKTIKVPGCLGEAGYFSIANILLEPGVNEVKFSFHRNWLGKLLRLIWKDRNEKVEKVEFKDFRIVDSRIIKTSTVKKEIGPQKFAALNDALDINFIISQPLLLSRNMDVDLEEFPRLNIEINSDREPAINLNILLGADFTGDGLIDDYLAVSELEDNNLVELIKQKWGSVDNSSFKLKRIVILIIPKNKDEINQDLTANISIKNLTLFNENCLLLTKQNQEIFPYPIVSQEWNARFLPLIKAVNPQLLEIDGLILRLNDFSGWQNFSDLEKKILVKQIKLTRGGHNYEKLENSIFEVSSVILEPDYNLQAALPSESVPQITFKKINPSKYLVKVEEASQPFWLVFQTSYHKQWRLYSLPLNSPQKKEFKNVLYNYPNLRITETEQSTKFTPGDLQYLFKKPLDLEHCLINEYANAWYVEPKNIGLGQNFILVIYFWPQTLFYLGLCSCAIIIFSCLIYLLCRRKK